MLRAVEQDGGSNAERRRLAKIEREEDEASERERIQQAKLDRLVDKEDDVLTAGGLYEEEGGSQGGGSIMSRTIEESVQKLIEGDKSDNEIDPVVKFQEIYATLKNSKGKGQGNNSTQSGETLDPAALLEQLFPTKKISTPFDERKVIVKVRSELNPEDMIGIFKGNEIGDLM